MWSFIINLPTRSLSPEWQQPTDDHRLSQWYIVYLNSSLGYSHNMEEDRVGNASEVHAASVFKVSKLNKFKTRREIMNYHYLFLVYSQKCIYYLRHVYLFLRNIVKQLH
jgi:hypothetical protein